jgi:hypothetical protein
MKYIPAQRLSAVHLSVLIFLSIALWIPRLQGPLDLRYDGGVYYILGSSLAQGKGYRLLNEPGEIQAIQYPPLLPLIAAGHQHLAGSTDPAVAGHWLRISFAIIFIGYIAAVYLLGKRYLSAGFAFLVALVSLLHVHASWLSDLFFAEIPLALISLLFLLTVGRNDQMRFKESLGGLLGVISFLLRSSGIALLSAWVLESLLRKRLRIAVFRFVLALVPVLVWFAYTESVKHSAEYVNPAYPYQRAAYQYYNVGYLENIMYLDPFVPEKGKASFYSMVQRIGRNLAFIPVYLGEAVSSRAEWSRSQLKRINHEFSPFPLPLWLVDLALGLFGLIILAGLWLLVLRGEWMIPLYVASSIALMCLTPWPGQFERYLAPITPLLAIALFIALIEIRKRLSGGTGKRRSRLAAVIFIAVTMGIFGQESFAIYKVYTKQHRQAFFEDERGMQQSYHLFFYTQAWRLHDAALDWLKSNAKPDEIVATSTPHRIYLKSGIKAVMPPFEPDVNKAQRLIDSVPVSYLIVDNLEFVDITRRYTAPVVRAYPQQWELIYSTGTNGSQIYQRVSSVGNKGSP